MAAKRFRLHHHVLLGAFCAGALLFVAGCPAPTPSEPVAVERSRIVTIKGERPGTARLDGIGSIRGFAKGRDCTFMHCLELILDAIGRKTDYDELMGLSGMAFRIQVCVGRWDVGNPDPASGADCLDPLFSALGMHYELRVVRREELAEAGALRKSIAASIDNGLPVLAANIIPPEDWGIITGYERNGWSWFCRSYNGGAESSDLTATGWPTAVVLLNSVGNPPDPKQERQRSIQRAVSLFERRSAGAYALGSNAFEHWCQMLRSADTRHYVHANAWTYIGLIDARGAAVRYLRQIADDFGSGKDDVLEAAKQYEQETRMLIEGLKYVPAEQQYPDGTPPSDLRTQQVTILMAAKAMETRAIESLRKAGT